MMPDVDVFSLVMIFIRISKLDAALIIFINSKWWIFLEVTLFK